MGLLPSRRAGTPPHLGDPALLAALAAASAVVARLDAATALHPLLPALLHRTRLDAARRQAAADGHLIDPWHLAAALEGLPLRAMRDSERIMDAGAIQDAARLALDYHGWLAAPDEAAEAAVRVALAALDGPRPYGVPLPCCTGRRHRRLQVGWRGSGLSNHEARLPCLLRRTPTAGTTSPSSVTR